MDRFRHLGRDSTRQHISTRNSRSRIISPDSISEGSVDLRAAFDSSFMNEPAGQTTTDAFGKAMMSDFEPKRPRSTSSAANINPKRLPQVKEEVDDTNHGPSSINSEGSHNRFNPNTASHDELPLFVKDNSPRPSSISLEPDPSPPSGGIPRPSPITEDMRPSTPHYHNENQLPMLSPSPSIASSFDLPRRAPSPEIIIEPRLHERREPEAPIIYDVPLSEMPTIDWCPVDVDTMGKPMDELEYSETESEYESDAGSVIEMLDDSSDSELGNDEDTLYVPEEYVEDGQGSDGNDDNDDDGDDDDEDYKDDDDSSAEATKISDLAIVEAFKVDDLQEPKKKRSRIPTLQWWNGERIEYRLEGTLQLPSAVAVRTVEEPQKQYRKRRTRKPRVTSSVPPEEGDIHAEVYDGNAEKWYDRTIAKSIGGLEFQNIYNSEGEAVPLVAKCVAFSDADQSPMRCYVLKIEPQGVYHSPAEDSKETTFFVWKGSCSASVNNNEFEISPGKACLAPKGNDLLICNNGQQEVLLFVTEVTDSELADKAGTNPHNVPSQITNSLGPAVNYEFDANEDYNDAAFNVNHDEGPDANEIYDGVPDEEDMVEEYHGGFIDTDDGGAGFDNNSHSENPQDENSQDENTIERTQDNQPTGLTFERYMDSMVPRTKAITERDVERDSLSAALFSDSPPASPIRNIGYARTHALNLRTQLLNYEYKNTRDEPITLRRQSKLEGIALQQRTDLAHQNGEHDNLDSFLRDPTEEQYSITSPRLLPSMLNTDSTNRGRSLDDIPPMRPPGRSPARSPVRSTARSPARSPAHSPVYSPVRVNRTSNHSPNLPTRSPIRIYDNNRHAQLPPGSSPVHRPVLRSGHFARVMSAPVDTYDPQSPLAEYSRAPYSVKLDLPPVTIPTPAQNVEDSGIREFLRTL